MNNDREEKDGISCLWKPNCGFEKVFNNVSVQRKNKLPWKIWSLVYQFASAFAKGGKGIFLTRGGGGGRDKDIPGSPNTDFSILAYSRLSDRKARRKEIWAKKNKKKKQRGLHYFIYRYFFILLLSKAAWQPSCNYGSPLLFRFLFFCIKSPEAWSPLDGLMIFWSEKSLPLYSVDKKYLVCM